MSLVNGKFGERMGKMGQRLGNITVLQSDWGAPLDLDGLEHALEEGANLVTLVHNETSSGIRTRQRRSGSFTRQHDALFVMDGITSIGGDLVEVDGWGVDIAFVGSQKCLAAPAGLFSHLGLEEGLGSGSRRRGPTTWTSQPFPGRARKLTDGDPVHPGGPPLPRPPRGPRYRERERGSGEANRAPHRAARGIGTGRGRGVGPPHVPEGSILSSEYSNTVTAVAIPDGVNEKVHQGHGERVRDRDHLGRTS